ncbi:MAG: tyrosine-type recombinase/integrase [Cyanobacteria bacterium SZAS TMP-1]|nr:tyrosine-type recombinase/integrase [Cyanobacteria bacterium SZAS TMP-1]
MTVEAVNSMLEVIAAKDIGRHGACDALLILMTHRRALRVSEAIDLKWDRADLAQGKLHVNRLKNGEPSVHYLEGDEIRALRKLRRSYPESAFIFPSERQGPLSASAVYKIVARAGVEAGLMLSVHPHMLRNGKGYLLASEGIDTRAIQVYMGHKNIQHRSYTPNSIQSDLKALGGM